MKTYYRQFPSVQDNACALTILCLSLVLVACGGGGGSGGGEDNTITSPPPTFSIGGTVSGLTGAGLVLQNNNGDDLSISADGAFVFSSSLVDASAYAVTVATTPSNPNQTCAITNASGNLTSTNITDVGIACTTINYAISGTVSGLTGAGLTLQNNNGDDLSIAADGVFTFSMPLEDLSSYAVTVISSPASPNQNCSVINGSGSLDGSDVTNVDVSCTNTYTVGGTVSGLTGTGLVLQNNGGDDLSISADGAFVFSSSLVDASAYAVTVATTPSNPNQTCAITNASGNLTSTNITDVGIACTTINYAISGTVSGLTGAGLTLQNNNGDDLSIVADGVFTFSMPLEDLSSYAVTVISSPASPNQNCSVINGSGSLDGSDVTNVDVSCTNTYTVGGTVSGLTGTALVLQNNGGDDLSISADGAFVFSSSLVDASAYAVTVATTPSNPNQTCAITNASGNLTSTNITDVGIACTTINYAISGTVSGLTGEGLVLQNNNGDDLSIAEDGVFTFSTPLEDLSRYAVTVISSPASPNQNCSVINGSGSLDGSDITNVDVSCTNSYTVGGSVSGLTGTGLVLQNNDGDDLSISSDGSFSFSMPLEDLSSFSVTISSLPTSPDQLCTVTNGDGSLAGSNVTAIAVSCVNSYSVGGTITGLVGTGLVLQNNGGDDLSVSSDGEFIFSMQQEDLSAFDVTILTAPSFPNQRCELSNANGSVASSNVIDISLSCVSIYTLGGTVSGLNGSGLVLQNNDGDDLSIDADGDFTFATPLDDFSAFLVTVVTRPSELDQSCYVSNGSGDLSSSDVTNVDINCKNIRVSLDAMSVEGDDVSYSPSVSADGRFVAFYSLATNLVADDTNERGDVFVRDSQTDTVTRASVDTQGNQSDGNSYGPSLSADGRYVAFYSFATNLVIGDDNERADIFVHDTQLGTTARVSLSSEGIAGNENSGSPHINADGRYISFASDATNLVSNDTNDSTDIFVHDTQTGVTIRVSVSSSGIEGSSSSSNGVFDDINDISDDGRYIAFESWANDLVTGPINGWGDIFVHDTQTGSTTQVSVDPLGNIADNGSYTVSMSGDGRFVTYKSFASNLDGINNGVVDVFVHDTVFGDVTRVSEDTESGIPSRTSSISDDGLYIGFHSDATDVVADDTNDVRDVFVHSALTDTTVRISINNLGVQGDDASHHPTLSADGRYFVFSSAANNLVTGDTNLSLDVFQVINPLYVAPKPLLP